ncbi:MAG TPA: bifunctional methylenetetrahydrofolate dehydrogenase/methenyltetrahydrofolate cyclohydrolase FolD [Chroococcales cyanobacterium]
MEMAAMIDGKALALQIEKEIGSEILAIASRHRAPKLAVVMVGENPASQIYVRNKEKACQRAGIETTTLKLPESASEGELLFLVEELGRNPQVDGILVQLPLPGQISVSKVISAIPPSKDVDGFHPLNLGKLLIGEDPASFFRPATPSGILEMLCRYEVPLSGKHAVIVGRSNIVGKPTALMLMEKHATITICHSRSQDLPSLVRNGDIVVAAVGRPNLIKGAWLKPGAVVIDVGMNRLPDNRLVGDVDFAEARDVASLITPVPGGVGPMTIAMLLVNTLKAYKMGNQIS